MWSMLLFLVWFGGRGVLVSPEVALTVQLRAADGQPLAGVTVIMEQLQTQPQSIPSARQTRKVFVSGRWLPVSTRYVFPRTPSTTFLLWHWPKGGYRVWG